MNQVPLTPLERWICLKIGLPPERSLDRQALGRYQLAAVNRTLGHVRRNSPFYRRHFSHLPHGPLHALADLRSFPFTTADDIRTDPLALVCVSQSRIARVVTLATSGTTGGPKRLFFTQKDLDLTVDFFGQGMTTLVGPGQRVLILMPGRLPGSIGDLLMAGLARMSVTGIVHGPVLDPGAAIQDALEQKVDSLVGIPVQVLAMACHETGAALAGQIQSVLLSTDYVPDAMVGRIERAWGCKVFKHYGMTEMGLGGAVACGRRQGYHFREADLLVEIVDPATGMPVPDGGFGEIVFTTLTRTGMPLVRYRTGDGGAFCPYPCPCGTVLKTLAAVAGRLDKKVNPGGGDETIFLGELDEALFAVSPVLDYTAELRDTQPGREMTLHVAIPGGHPFDPIKERLVSAVTGVPAIGRAVSAGRLKISMVPATPPLAASTGTAKRGFQN